MTHSTVACKHGNCKLKALSLDLPVILGTNLVDLLGNVEYALSFVLCNSVKNIQWVNSDVDFWIIEANQCIVEENIKPFFSEHLLLCDEECMTGVNNFIFLEELLKWLYNLDTHLKVMAAVGIDQLANILTLVWWLLDDWTVVSEKVRHEKLSKVLLELLHSYLGGWSGSLSSSWIDVNLDGEIFAHVHCIGEAMVDWVKLFEHHKEIGEKNHHLVGRIVKNLQNKINILLHFLNEAVKCLITDHINWIKETSDQVPLNFNFLQICIFSTHDKCSNFIIKIWDNGLDLVSLGSMVKLISRIDSGSVVGVTSLT